MNKLTTPCFIVDEKKLQENIEKILENIGLNSEVKKEIKNIDWKHTNINKIRKNFNLLEEDLENKKKIICGRNIFIDKVNQAIDLWVKNNIEKLENAGAQISVINCFSFEENKNSENISNSYEYILRTTGIEEILKEELLKAN